MKIGGKHWQAVQAQQKKFSHGQRLNRRAALQSAANMQAIGHSIFETNVMHGQASVRMTLENMFAGVKAEMDAMKSRMDQTFAGYDTFRGSIAPQAPEDDAATPGAAAPTVDVRV